MKFTTDLREIMTARFEDRQSIKYAVGVVMTNLTAQYLEGKNLIGFSVQNELVEYFSNDFHYDIRRVLLDHLDEFIENEYRGKFHDAPNDEVYAEFGVAAFHPNLAGLTAEEVDLVVNMAVKSDWLYEQHSWILVKIEKDFLPSLH